MIGKRYLWTRSQYCRTSGCGLTYQLNGWWPLLILMLGFIRLPEICPSNRHIPVRLCSMAWCTGVSVSHDQTMIDNMQRALRCYYFSYEMKVKVFDINSRPPLCSYMTTRVVPVFISLRNFVTINHEYVSASFPHFPNALLSHN